MHGLTFYMRLARGFVDQMPENLENCDHEAKMVWTLRDVTMHKIRVAQKP